MLRPLTSPERPLVGALVVLMACAVFVPVSWLRWWTNDLAAIIDIPLMPFEQFGTTFRTWVRPASDIGSISGDVRLDLEDLREQKASLEALLLQSQREADELRDQVQQLQQTRDLLPQIRPRVLIARVAAVSPGQAMGPLTLNRGANAGVTDDAVAVWLGGYLLGRVIEVDRLRSMLLPLTNPGNAPANGSSQALIRARIFPRDWQATAPARSEFATLRNAGNGTFEADVDHLIDVKVGDVARLDDPSWPAPAQMLIIGEVEQIRPNEQNPVSNTLIIRPQFRAAELPYVTLKMEDVAIEEPAP